jgi:hypothetical protein
MLTLTKERVPRERSHDVSYIAFDLERRVHVVQVEMAAIVTVETVARDVATSSYGKRSGLTVATCVAPGQPGCPHRVVAGVRPGAPSPT